MTEVNRPRGRRRLLPIMVALVCVALIGVGGPTEAAAKAKKPEVTLSAPAKATVGKALLVEAVVKRGVSKQKISLERRVGAAWTKVASTKLPDKGRRKKTVTFSVTPTAAGTELYRAVLAKKGETKKAVSDSVQVTVVKPTVPPTSNSAVTLSTSTSTTGAYGSETTNVTFSGTVTNVPAGTQVLIQYARGKNPAAGAWSTATTVLTTGDTSPRAYSGTVTIPVVRAGVVGAPQLNLRAVVGSAMSSMKSYLIRTRYDGVYVIYDENDEIVSEDTFQVFYSDKVWRFRFGVNQAQGATDGWNLLNSNGLNWQDAVYHDPGLVCDGTFPDGSPNCHGDEDKPWIEYVATYSLSTGEPRRLEGRGYFN